MSTRRPAARLEHRARHNLPTVPATARVHRLRARSARPVPSRTAAPARRTAAPPAAAAGRRTRSCVLSSALVPAVPVAGAAQINRAEDAVLAQFDAARAGEFEGRG